MTRSLALFDGPGLAIRCAAAISDAARDSGLHVRAGVHVGEVELVGAAIRGVTVHEGSRMMSVASADQSRLADRAIAGGRDGPHLQTISVCTA